MAKTRPKSKSSRLDKRKRNLLNTTGGLSSNPLTTSSSSSDPTESLSSLLTASASALHDSSDAQTAHTLASHALTLAPKSLAALELLAEATLELCDPQTSYELYSRAAALDPSGTSTGPEKFLWLAQLTPAGGNAAVAHYETAVEVLRTWLAKSDTPAERGLHKKLVSALCAMAELYMSDLCMESDAEARCERYVAEALLAAPESAEALQTLASVRISQQRVDDARAALGRARAVCAGESYPSRIALARLLIEVEMLEEAVEIIEGCQAENDELPDLWYLGGWALFLMGELTEERPQHQQNEKGEVESKQDFWRGARDWLLNCRRLCQVLEWEDEGIVTHTEELLAKIVTVVGEDVEHEEAEDEDEDVNEAEWESDSDVEDEEMND